MLAPGRTSRPAPVLLTLPAAVPESLSAPVTVRVLEAATSKVAAPMPMPPALLTVIDSAARSVPPLIVMPSVVLVPVAVRVSVPLFVTVPRLLKTGRLQLGAAVNRQHALAGDGCQVLEEGRRNVRVVGGDSRAAAALRVHAEGDTRRLECQGCIVRPDATSDVIVAEANVDVVPADDSVIVPAVGTLYTPLLSTMVLSIFR